MPDYPTPPVSEILERLVEAVHQFGHWKEIDSGCGGAGPFVMAHRALGIPLPPEVAEWVAAGGDSDPPFPDPAGYPWSTNHYALRPPGER